MKTPPLIPVGALRPWWTLTAAIADTAVPCRGTKAHLWTSEAAEDRIAATFRCTGCPVLSLCASYADAAGEKFGTWAGVDRTTTRPAGTTTET